MRAFPATMTCPSLSSATPVDRSRSRALSEGHDDGAKNCDSDSEGESSKTESLSS